MNTPKAKRSIQIQFLCCIAKETALCSRRWISLQALLIIVSSVASAPTALAQERTTIIRSIDPYGNVQYSKPSLSVQPDGRIVEVDPYGNRQYHKPQYQIESGRVIQKDAYGNRKLDTRPKDVP